MGNRSRIQFKYVYSRESSTPLKNLIAVDERTNQMIFFLLLSSRFGSEALHMANCIVSTVAEYSFDYF